MQLTKGANTAFVAENIEIIWAQNPGNAELDVSAFMLGENRKVLGDEGMVFYGQPSVPGASLANDQSQYKSVFTLSLDRIDPAIHTIAFCVALDTTHDPSQRLSNARKITLRAGEDYFDLDVMECDEQALILAEVYRRSGAFKIRAVGQGFRGGLNALATSFGIEIAEAPQPVPEPLNAAPVNDRIEPEPTLSKSARQEPSGEPRACRRSSNSGQGVLSTVTNRLAGMIDYIIACEKEKLKLVTDVSNHRFHKECTDIAQLPGVHLNTAYADGTAWFQLERLEKQLPPEPTDQLLAPWAILIDDTIQQPRLRSSLSAELCAHYGIELETDHQQISFENYAFKEQLESALTAYINGPWTAWSETERERRKSIALYAELFGLYEILTAPDGTPQELVCGMGFATLKRNNNRLRYPLITVQVEIELDKDSHIISIVPREEVPPTIEHETLDHMELRQVDQWSKVSREFLNNPSAPVFSPFTYESYTEILRRAAGLLDPEAVYLDGEGGGHVAIPALTDQLVISNSFSFIQRERRGTQLMADLTAYQSKLKDNPDPEDLPGAIKVLFTDPSEKTSDENYPTFRGINSIPNVTSSNGTGKDLYFPKPFNGEQVQIAQRLAVREGVVVQGPPGTGKTHTIANIISHYLATGKRVLVTSQKASALHVLKAQLPPAVRPLAISLLDSDREGLREFQASVELIAQTLQSMLQSEMEAEITALEAQIEGLHRQLARHDTEIERLGRSSLQSVELDGQQIDPLSAAQEILAAGDDANWLQDSITTAPDHTPQFSDNDVAMLREARKDIGAWISHIDKEIPDEDILRDVEALVSAHQDMSNASQLERKIQNREVWALNHSADVTAEALIELCERIQLWNHNRADFNNSAAQWDAAAETLLHEKHNPIMGALQALKTDAECISDDQSWFLIRPIELPAGYNTDPKFRTTLDDLRQGGSGLGALAGIFASKTKQNLAAVRIKGSVPSAPADWEDVHRYICAIETARTFAASWNHAISGSGLPKLINEDLAAGREALSVLAYFSDLKNIHDEASRLFTKLRSVLIQWPNEINRFSDISAELTCLQLHIDHARLAEAKATQQMLHGAVGSGETDLHRQIRSIANELGDIHISAIDFRAKVDAVQANVKHLHSIQPKFKKIRAITSKIRASGANLWAEGLSLTSASGEDPLCPADWAKRWRLRRLTNWLDASPKHEEFRRLHQERQAAEQDLARAYTNVIEKRTWLALKNAASQSVMSSLQAYSVAVGKIGRGTGKSAERHRRDARKAANGVKGALPCWIMPHYKVSESLPSEFGIFDLVIIDEASQSSLSALPALFRAKQILIVGDDKQVSPDNVGLDSEKANRRAALHLAEQVPLFASVLREEYSLYDVGKVIFGNDSLMLREHFRSVAPIIEYSKKHFYGNELLPLRLSKASERLDPVLIDVRVIDGVRDGKLNKPEAEYIISELRRMGEDPAYEKRTFGVTTLLGTEQAALINKMIHSELGIPFIEKHNVRVGDPASFQGDERDIMFLSLVVSPGKAAALSGNNFDQRFNVAASRARERMILVRSVDIDHLSPADGLRRTLLEHFHSPFAKDAADQGTARDRCESGFEFEMFDLLAERGYQIDTQVKVGAHRIDMVVEGDEDRRLAIECDGDRYHGPDQWPADMARQRTLERAGWRFWRCFASRFVREKTAVAEELFALLSELGIQPRTATERSRQYTEYREWNSLDAKNAADAAALRENEEEDAQHMNLLLNPPALTSDASPPNSIQISLL